MLRKSVIISTLPVTLLPWDRKRCIGVTIYVMFQCILVYIGSATIIYCVWSPDDSNTDYGKVTRIMYLYDYEACGHKLRTSSGLANVQLSNNTFGLNIKPIAWSQALVAVSTRLSSKTRRYIKSSLGVHIIWMTVALLLHIILRKTDNQRVLKFFLLTFLYASIFMIIFDISMATVYIADIQQSLTMNMVLRYSGWNVELKLENGDNFAGWLPMAASILWMRGVLFFVWNVYSCKLIYRAYRKIKKREVRTRLMVEGYLPIPEPRREQDDDAAILHFRTGENKPYVKDTKFLHQIFYAVFAIILSWLTLSCRFQPRETELHEMTLVKLLYLYDPEACGRVFFYNHTCTDSQLTAILWPVRNSIAAGFRQMVQVWLSLHVIWAVLGVVYMFQGQRPCGLYVALIPFTVVGAAVLVMDVAYTATFLMDAEKTNTEDGILNYINANSEDIHSVQSSSAQSPLLRKHESTLKSRVDTSWISLMMAYISCRAIVQWVINFWLIKDNYCAGLAFHRRMHKTIKKHTDSEDTTN